MARTKTEYVCQSCGHKVPKWLGKCPECGDWNTFAEEVTRPASSSAKLRSRSNTTAPPKVMSITDVAPASSTRLGSGIGELDRVLGGGLVPGSLILLGGDPGIGKSTLVLQSLFEMANAGNPVLYVSGEESPEQIQLRASRLNRLPKNFRVFLKSAWKIFFVFLMKRTRLFLCSIPFRLFTQQISLQLRAVWGRCARWLSRYFRNAKAADCQSGSSVTLQRRSDCRTQIA